MGIFKRVKRMVTADVHELLEKAENPVSLLNQYVRELEEQIGKAKEALGQQLYLEARQAQLVAEAEAAIAKRTRQAELAVAKNEEAIAKLALQEKLQQEAKLALYQEQQTAMKQQTVKLQEQVDGLLAKYDELSHKRLLLTSRAHAAKSQQQTQTAIASFGADSAVAGFARVEDYVQRLEAQAAAGTYFVPAAPSGLELQDAVERELAKLKESK